MGRGLPGAGGAARGGSRIPSAGSAIAGAGAKAGSRQGGRHAQCTGVRRKRAIPNTRLAIAEQLDKEYPSSTFLQRYWLPLIRAEVELRDGRGEKAVSILTVVEPLDAAVLNDDSVGELYPAYVRGQAYLAAGDGRLAVGEFQKLLDHSGLVLNSVLGALARLGCARGYARMGDAVKARAGYEDFFRVWKDGNAGIPVLQQARQEFRKIP